MAGGGVTEKSYIQTGLLAPDHFLYKFSVPDDGTGDMLSVYVCRKCGSRVAGLGWLNTILVLTRNEIIPE